MKPTPELRWVMRKVVLHHYGNDVVACEMRPILQQKWVGREYMGEVEWRDVPTVEETV